MAEEEVLIKEPTEYDPVAGKKLAEWCWALFEYTEREKSKKVDPSQWDKVWEFVRGKQWEGDFPSYRRPIVHNTWRRTLHILLSVITGERPIIKVVPQGQISQQEINIIQHALWAIFEKEEISQKYEMCCLWAWICNGGWMKVGYGTRNPLLRFHYVDDSERAKTVDDVIVECIHPAKIFVDPECTDPSLASAAYIIYREVVDFYEVCRRFPQQAKYVVPDDEVSISYVRRPVMTGLQPSHESERASFNRPRVTILEVWLDDPSLELYYEKKYVGVDADTGQPLYESVPRWRPKYPFGRTITCTKDVVLRDMPNPYGECFGWEMRWPFVYLQGSVDVDPIWSPGVLSSVEEEQRAINRCLQLLLENIIRFTSGYVIADINAIDEEEWETLRLFPGAKIRKTPQSEFRIEYPQPIPEHALRVPDYFSTKIEQEVGLHDPPVTPGQAVAAKTVEFLQRKGNFLLGLLAKKGDEFLERLGSRILGLMLYFYQQGRPIPYFDRETYQTVLEYWPALPQGLRLRVEASSAWLEILAALQRQERAERERRGRGQR
ncbi:MAG: hypothetical protein QXT26_06570 [Thermoproteota archaeon]